GPKIDSAELRDKGVIMVWDIETGRAVGTLDGYWTAFWRGQARKSGALPGGWLLQGSWSTLTIRPLHDQHRTPRVTDTSPDPLAAYQDDQAVLTPDGVRALARDGNEVQVWDLATGQLERTLRGHADQVNAVAVTPDGKTAVSASDDQTLQVWDISKARAEPECS